MSVETELQEITEIGKKLLVPVKLVRPFSNQPRTYFNKKRLKELADSIKENGQITPASVRRIFDDSNCLYELIDGQRRWHAIQIAGKRLIKIVVTENGETMDEFTQFKLSLISNFGREEHTPIEIAEAIKRCQDKGLTIEKIANIFVKSVSWVTQHLTILKLEPDILDMMSPEIPKEERLTYSTALDIAILPASRQLPIAKIIMNKQLKMNEARNLIQDELLKENIQHKRGGRPRKPDDDHRTIKNFIKRTTRDLNLLLKKPDEFFYLIFQHRSEEDPVYMRHDIMQIKEGFTALSEKISKALDKKKAGQ